MKISMLLAAVMVFSLSPPLQAKSFLGWSCTQDCEGHKAGYEWAEANDIHNENDCIGRSRSFIEGCLAFIEDNEDLSDFFGSDAENFETSENSEDEMYY